MHCQVLTHKIDIVFRAFLHFPDLHCFLRASNYAFGEFPAFTYTIIALGIQIGDKIGKDHPKRTGEGARFAAGAAHLVTFQVPVRGALQGIMVARAYARGLFAMPADGGKGGVFTYRCHPVILRMVEIITTGAAFLAGAADIQINK
jgi:hypothetical protein